MTGLLQRQETFVTFHNKVKVKVKFALEQDTKTQKGSKGRPTPILFLELRAPDRGGCSTPRPRPLYRRGRNGVHVIGGWLGPRAGLDGCAKSRSLWDSIPRLSSP